MAIDAEDARRAFAPEREAGGCCARSAPEVDELWCESLARTECPRDLAGGQQVEWGEEGGKCGALTR